MSASTNGLVNTNRLVRVIERKAEVMDAHPARIAPLRQAAESLSRANMYRAHCEVLAEALARCTMMLYERDSVGRWVNMDRTGQALIALPWGRAGQRLWGLRRSEANTLRAILFGWQHWHDARREPALYLYGENERRWWLNLADYPDQAAGMRWVQAHPITLNQWRAYSEPQQ